MTRGDRTLRSAARLDLRLLQPESLVHRAVHGGRRRDVLLRLLESARAPVELAEAQMAVGDKGPHAALLGERQRVAENDPQLPSRNRGGRRRRLPSAGPAGDDVCRRQAAGGAGVFRRRALLGRTGLDPRRPDLGAGGGACRAAGVSSQAARIGTAASNARAAPRSGASRRSGKRGSTCRSTATAAAWSTAPCSAAMWTPASATRRSPHSGPCRPATAHPWAMCGATAAYSAPP